MFKKTIITGLIAAIALPGMAMPAAAQDRELRRDRQDIRREARDLRQAERYGSPRDVREARRDLRDAHREYRDDRRDRRWGRDDWRGWRNSNRAIYARGNWRAPFRYNAFRPGVRIAPNYYGPRYFIADTNRFRLPPAGRFQRWVRHYDDVILVDTRRGVVVDVIRGFYW